ncbi:hypothetical protein [Nocardia sp. NBC_00416]|uniref:hypothetical protein n=1 Tax=Nocardia sp. NBC_00416 TaxID=2975991 RepID=UPI002E24D4AD
MADESGVSIPGSLTADHPLVRALIACAPEGWERIDAVFAITVTGHIGTVVSSDGRHAVSVPPPDAVIDLVREHRVQTAGTGPWWRISLALTAMGELETGYDYGDEPFPEGQLLPAPEYRADLEAFPRERVPVWLGAYIGHGDRQRRTPRQAAERARADRAGQVWPTLAENEFPPFPVMWARWATVAAAFVAAGSDWGPRIEPRAATFEGAGRGGSSLHVLTHGRAVLSGGVWEAPELDAVYNRSGPMPEHYRGAPDWVADPVLNPRAAAGLLSFCYWWEAGRWYRGQSPSARDCATAIPGVWTAEIVHGLVGGLIEAPDTAQNAITALLTAAEAGKVDRAALVAVFGDTGQFDIDSALYQFTLAGLTATAPEPMPSGQAIDRVRDYITGRALDTTGYPLAELVAERFSVGWLVYVPVPAGEIAIGRAVFYLADDGMLEHSTSSIAPATFIAEFERAFARRHGLEEVSDGQVGK